MANLTPSEVIAAWTSTIAVASLVNKFVLGKYLPKVSRFVSAIISIPAGHLANVVEDLQVLWNDIKSPPAAPINAAPVKEEPK